MAGQAWAPFLGHMGATSALVFANVGAAYGTARSGMYGCVCRSVYVSVLVCVECVGVCVCEVCWCMCE